MGLILFSRNNSSNNQQHAKRYPERKQAIARGLCSKSLEPAPQLEGVFLLLFALTSSFLSLLDLLPFHSTFHCSPDGYTLPLPPKFDPLPLPPSLKPLPHFSTLSLHFIHAYSGRVPRRFVSDLTTTMPLLSSSSTCLYHCLYRHLDTFHHFQTLSSSVGLPDTFLLFP